MGDATTMVRKIKWPQQTFQSGKCDYANVVGRFLYCEIRSALCMVNLDEQEGGRVDRWSGNHQD